MCRSGARIMFSSCEPLFDIWNIHYKFNGNMQRAVRPNNQTIIIILTLISANSDQF